MEKLGGLQSTGPQELDKTERLHFHFHCIQGQGQRPAVATPRPRPGAAAETSNPTSKEQWLRGHRRAERSYSMFKVRRGGSEEIPLVQGKEQWLGFAGAVVRDTPRPR